MYAHTSGALRTIPTRQLRFGLNTSSKENYMGTKHRVKTHRWDRGVLQTMEHWFDSLEEATLFSGNVDAHSVKVYNPNGELLDSRTMSTLPEQINIRKSPVTEDGYSY